MEKVKFYSLVENLVRHPRMVLQCSCWWLWASLCPVYHVVHGAKVCNIYGRFDLDYLFKVSTSPIQLWIFILLSFVVYCGYNFDRVLWIWARLPSADRSAVLESENPSQTQQTRVTSIHKVLFKVNFPNLIAFFFCCVNRMRNLWQIYRIWEQGTILDLPQQ